MFIIKNSADANQIIIAVVSNLNFFSPNATPENKIKQVVELIESVDKAIE